MRPIATRLRRALSVVAVFVAAAGADPSIRFHPENDGLVVPEGFQVAVVAEGIGLARHLVVRDNGDIYVALSSSHAGKSLAALRDEDGDGVADQIHYFGDYGVCGGVELYAGYLYFASTERVYRVRLDEEALVPQGAAEIVVDGFSPNGPWHNYKIPVIDDSGHLYVGVGAPSNACQEEWRTAGSPGMDPCPHLAGHAGIWKFAADKIGQRQRADGVRFATGLRNSVAMAWDQQSASLYAVPHGRDLLHTLWPEHYDDRANAALPAEQFFRVQEGTDGGWPYTYYDPHRGERMVAPEYGGDGATADTSGRFDEPILAFPAHWAPNDLLFYAGDQFPARYRGGAFVAFIGGWFRAPYPQEGFQVAFVPFDKGQPAGGYEAFAIGFAGREVVDNPGDARARPTGLALGPDGSLYIADMVQGRIWRVVYTGAAGMEPVVRTEAERKTNGDAPGAEIYKVRCAACHMSDGSGVPNLQPSLRRSSVVNGDALSLILLVLEGRESGAYAHRMPPFAHLDDEAIAAVLTYVRGHFGNRSGSIDAGLVRRLRGPGQ